MKPSVCSFRRFTARRALAHIGLWVLAMISLEVTLQSAEPQLLFKPLGATADLNERQAMLRNRLINRMTTKAGEPVSVVRMEPLPATADVPLRVNVAGTAMDLSSYHLARIGQENSLQWNDLERRQTVTMAWSADRAGCAGLIYSDMNVYEVTPLGGGLQAIVPLDQSKFHEDHPPIFKEIAKRDARKVAAAAAATNNNADEAPTEITVLVAYTPKVRDNVGDIHATISGAIAVSNTSYVNSNVNLRLKLVHSIEVDYQESATHEIDLDKLKASNDGVMDNVHTLRDLHKADICVLLIDNSSYCGLAAAILAAKETAFAVVHYDCAIGNLSFAHEIGHLQGARHDFAADDTVDNEYPWNHGFLIPGTNGRTVMAYPAASNPLRLPNWSNPDVKYNGVPTGTVDKHNNSRMLNASRTEISNFRP